MKKNFILSFMLMISFLMSAQETVTLKFTSHLQNDSYIPFDFVYVRDITHNWIEALNYPDTTMVLTAYDGIDELGNKDSYLSDAFPNPFSCYTNILYSIEKPQQINVRLYSINGGRLCEFNGFLEEGTHCFTIEMDKPQMAFFVVTSSDKKCVKKVLNIGYGNSNKIEINKINGDIPNRNIKVGNFSIGDLMKYEAVIYDNGNNISNTIIQNQYDDETLVFTFDLNKPTVTTRQVTNITTTTGISGGNVTSNGGISVTERGICWSTSHNPTLNNNHASNGDGSGNYAVTMTGLTQNTTYYVRAYAINRVGVGYGDEVSFTTAQGNTVPTVTTNQVTNITQTTAAGGGNVTSNGGATITTRGVCWSTSHNPTISDSHASSGAGNGLFTVNINGLTANTTYYVRAYATNNVGTAYGSEVSFTSAQGNTVPTVTTNQVTNITQTTATGGGNVTSDGGAPVTARGICWSTNHNPTTSGNHTTNGTGTGSFTADMTGLTANTTYYVRAYATNNVGTAYGSEVSFTTSQNVIAPTVTTSNVTNITQTTATGGGNVTSDGGAPVTARGICWSTNHNPTTSGNHTTNGTGTGSFTADMTGLTANTTYYVRAYATNSVGTSYGNEVSFTTEQAVSTYTISLSSNPIEGGTTIGGGTYQSGQTCTIYANANVGYSFANWTENGNVISNSATYNFTVTSNRNIVANFTPHTYIIQASGSPSNGGSVTGQGTYHYGDTCTLEATANLGYVFDHWSVYSYTYGWVSVSNNANISIVVVRDEMYKAFFIVRPGVLNGRFSVSNTQQVYFSQGNLQYKASTNTWRFATNQFDYIGSDNSNISSIYSDWIDLFGWGTSGYNHGAVAYQPCSTSTTNSDYYAYGNYQYNLYDQNGKADWGYNAMSNGGNMENQWRTLTQSEWVYVFNTRNTSSGIRFAKAIVNGISGVILLPDNWDANYYLLNSTNNADSGFNSNIIDITAWSNYLEAHGAVFLPAAGYRNGTSVNNVGNAGIYWSASKYYSVRAYSVNFSDEYLNLDGNPGRHAGNSVRLVYDVQ